MPRRPSWLIIWNATAKAGLSRPGRSGRWSVPGAGAGATRLWPHCPPWRRHTCWGGTIVSIVFGVKANLRATEALQAIVAKDEALVYSDSLRLIARSELERPRNPVLGLLLAVEGGQRGRPRTVLHNNALLAAMFACNERRSFDGERVLDAVRVGPRSADQHICFRDAELSADGRWLLTRADTSGLESVAPSLLQVWETETGRLRTVLHVPALHFETAHLSPNGTRIVTTSKAWIRVHHADGRECVYTPNAARVWDAITGKEVAVLKGHQLAIVTAEFSPDGKQILTASWDRTARVWDAATGQQRTLIKTDPYPVRWALFTAAGQRVLTFSFDQGIGGIPGHDPGKAVVDPPLPTARIDTVYEAYSSSFEPGHSYGGFKEDAPPRLWDAATGQLVATLGQGPEVKDQTTATAISPDGTTIVTGFYKGEATNAQTRKLFLWDGKTGPGGTHPAPGVRGLQSRRQALADSWIEHPGKYRRE
jgi:WD40 repeat protein